MFTTSWTKAVDETVVQEELVKPPFCDWAVELLTKCVLCCLFCDRPGMFGGSTQWEYGVG
jgi:hypothetical protein